jgi:hypothetical protein
MKPIPTEPSGIRQFLLLFPVRILFGLLILAVVIAILYGFLYFFFFAGRVLGRF